MNERLTELEDKQMDIMIRLNNLSMATGSLRNETAKNRDIAKEAKSQANNATMLASSLEQVRMPLVFELLLKNVVFSEEERECGLCSITIM